MVEIIIIIIVYGLEGLLLQLNPSEGHFTFPFQNKDSLFVYPKYPSFIFLKKIYIYSLPAGGEA